MKIKNIDGLKVSEIQAIINDGGKFVYFPYTISAVVVTFSKTSAIYLIRPYEKSIRYSYMYVLTNVVAGWWALPWGPIKTIGSMYQHLKGGKDVTSAVMSGLLQHDPEANTSNYNIAGVMSSNAGQKEEYAPTYNLPK